MYTDRNIFIPLQQVRSVHACPAQLTKKDGARWPVGYLANIPHVARLYFRRRPQLR